MAIRLEERHWLLWAIRQRQVPGSEIGYDSRQPWYLPPRGWRQHTLAESLGHVDENDEALIAALEHGVRALGQENPKGEAALRAWWGAFRGATRAVERNCRKLRVSRSHVYANRERFGMWVALWIGEQLAESA